MIKQIRILAVYTLYNPQLELLKQSIESIVNHVEKIILYDNSPSKVALDGLANDTSIIYQHSNINSISMAYNFAFRYAKTNGYNYILTMDQDSCFYDFGKFIEDIRSNDVCGIVGCNMDNKQSDCNQPFIQVPFLQNSGTMHKTDLVELLDGWDETFTIDCIDHDYCYKARKMNVPVYIDSRVFLNHKIGEEKTVKIANKTIYITSYSPNRLYLMFRDYILFFKKWGDDAAQLKRHFTKGWLRNSLKILLFDNECKWSKLHAILKGTIHGIKQRIPLKENPTMNFN